MTPLPEPKFSVSKEHGLVVEAWWHSVSCACNGCLLADEWISDGLRRFSSHGLAG